MLDAVDKAVTSRWEAAVRAAERTRGTRQERIDQLTRRFSNELGVLGAAAGATAAVPGIGFVSLAGAAAELSWFTLRAGDLILSVAAVHGHDDASVEERRAWILSILAFGDSAAPTLVNLAGDMAKRLGSRATSQVPATTLRRVNRVIGRTVVKRYGTSRGLLAMGRAIPFGVGAAVGWSSNRSLARRISGQADAFFTELARP